MKTIKLITAIGALVLSTGLFSEINAQPADLTRMIQKLFASDTHVSNFEYSGEDKSMPTKTTKIIVPQKELMDEFIGVFNKASKSANLCMTNRKDQGEVTSAIFEEGGVSHMYSYFFIPEESNFYVIYSKYNNINAAKGYAKSLTADANALIPKIILPPMNFSSFSMSFDTDSILMAIPHRIDIAGKCIITDGVRFINSVGLGFGKKRTEGEAPLQTNRKITFILPTGSYIDVDYQKCTIEEARKKGLNIIEF